MTHYCHNIFEKAGPRFNKRTDRLYKGVLWDLLSFMKRARNCTFTFEISMQYDYGNCHASDNCTGMIGQVNAEEVDFGLGTSFQTY